MTFILCSGRTRFSRPSPFVLARLLALLFIEEDILCDCFGNFKPFLYYSPSRTSTFACARACDSSPGLCSIAPKLFGVKTIKHKGGRQKRLVLLFSVQLFPSSLKKQLCALPFLGCTFFARTPQKKKDGNAHTRA